MKFYLTTFLLLFFSLMVKAQNFEISGTVKDANTDLPIPGVSVNVVDGGSGAVTDFDGNYTISEVPPGSTLEFSYLGYETFETVVNSDNNLNILLFPSINFLDEIVVIGYGTQKKKESTGAVSVISSEIIEDIKPVRIEQALQGQVAGVEITAQSGAPGSASNIRIRGISTNGDNRPFILVDGNVVEDLSLINPSDIESINVLKDATAGIYGARAANGVILITTKNGRKNTDFKFTFNTYAGIQETSRKIPLLNATEYALLANEAFAANGEPLPFPNASGLSGADWQNEVFDTAPIASADITVEKGLENATFSFGASYLNQEGIVGSDKASFDRITARLNANVDFLKNFKFTSSSVYANTNRRSLIENALGSVLFNALNMPATSSVRDANGDFTLAPVTGVGIEVINPLAQVANTHNKTWVNKFSGSYGLNYKFFEHFSVESRIQFNESKVEAKVFSPEVYYGQGKVFNTVSSLAALTDDENQATVNESETTFRDYTFDAFVKYEREFNDLHDVKVLLGTSVFRTQGINEVNLTGFGANGNSLDEVSVATSDTSQDNLELSNAPRRFFDSRLLSYFARLQYDYKDKYFFSAVLRRDGSSNFGPENKFGFFPTASASWIISEEDFMADSNFFDFFKLRGSYGIIGNDRIPSFRFVSTLSGEGVYVLNDELNFGTALGAISNPEIQWEEQKPLDIGIDMRFLNRFDITIDYFNKKTEKLLLVPEVSGILGPTAPGSSPPVVNGGTVENKGFEFSIGYSDNITDELKIELNYHLTTIDNEVLLVNSESGFLQGGSFGVGQNPPSRMEEGFPLGYFYGLQTDGIFQNQAEVDAHATQANAAPGDLRFVDTNGDGEITEADRTNIGNPIPDVTMGFNLSLDYKNFDFKMFAAASLGNEIVRNYERTLPLTNRSVYFLDRWRGEGTSNSFPRVTTGATSNNLFSDFFVEDGSFVRLQNVQLGYTVNKETTQKIGIDKLRLYFTGNNLVTLTEYKGYDPTINNGAPIGGGIDQGFYPTPKTYIFGLNVKF